MLDKHLSSFLLEDKCVFLKSFPPTSQFLCFGLVCLSRCLNLWPMNLDFIDPVTFCFSVFDSSQHAFRLLDIVRFLLFSRMKNKMFHIYTFQFPHTIFCRNCKLIKWLMGVSSTSDILCHWSLLICTFASFQILFMYTLYCSKVWVSKIF